MAALHQHSVRSLLVADQAGRHRLVQRLVHRHIVGLVHGRLVQVRNVQNRLLLDDRLVVLADAVVLLVFLGFGGLL